MKDKLNTIMQKFSRSIIQPIMYLSVTGLLLSFSVIMKMEVMPAGIRAVGDFVNKLMLDGGLNQLSIIFCVGLAATLANKKKSDAAILGLMVFLVFIYANNIYMSMTGLLVEGRDVLNGTGQAIVLGQQVVDMGVFLGIMLGAITGYIFNKFSDVKFPDAVSIYGGPRFAYLIMIGLTIGIAIISAHVWPIVNGIIYSTATALDKAGAVGVFGYGFLNRFLIPTGLHHLIYMPFLYTPLGGTAEIAGEVFSGAAMISFGQIANIGSVTELHESVKWMLFGFSKVFGSIGLTLAFIKTAKPELKAKAKGFLLPSLFVALLSGITEPLEFTFLFISPLLWLVHSVLDGLGQMLVFMLGGRFPLVNGLISAVSSFIVLPSSLSKWFILVLVGVVFTGLWYFSFKFLIEKFNLKTPGREEEELVEINTGKISEAATVEGLVSIIAGLGGKENIKSLNNCFTRLRVEVENEEIVNEELINEYPHRGIVNNGKNIQVIIGMDVSNVRESIADILGIE